MRNSLENEVLRQGLLILSYTQNPRHLKIVQKSIGDGQSLYQIQWIDNSNIFNQIEVPLYPYRMTISQMQRLSSSLVDKSIQPLLQCQIEQIYIKSSTYKCCRRCNSKGKQLKNLYWCERCDSFVEIKNKFCLKATLIDETGSQDVRFFDERLKFLEISGDEWVKLRKAQKITCLNKFDLQSDYQFRIQIKPKQENEFYYNVQEFSKLQ